VKRPFTEYRRRGLVPIAGLVLVAYYLIILLPLSRKANELDELNKAWQKLSLSLDQTNISAIDFLHITNQLSETRQALLTLENAKKDATARLQLDAALRLKVHGDFVLVEYENERSRQAEALDSLAKQAKVALDPTILSSYPEYTFDVLRANYLWAALSFTDSLLRTAVGCKVTAIQALDVPPVLTSRPSASSGERLVEIPVHLEFTGSATNADKFLQCLPLRGDEARAAGLTNAPADKPVIFIDRLVVEKQSPEKLDEVHVWLRAVGFVLRE
jgi:hypothetical protein